MKRKRFKRVTLRIGSVMEDEIGEEFERSGFTFDEEEEILKKYIQSPNPGFLEANQAKITCCTMDRIFSDKGRDHGNPSYIPQ